MNEETVNVDGFGVERNGEVGRLNRQDCRVRQCCKSDTSEVVVRQKGKEVKCVRRGKKIKYEQVLTK